mgnify:CR=1 FL=1
MKQILLLAVYACGLLVMGVGAQAQVVTITAGSNGSALSPFNSTQPNAVYEVIYKQSQINLAGPITRLAFEKNSGSFQDPLTRTTIYLKHTTATVFTAGSLDTTGYQRVWSGSFPNTGISGYHEVTLPTPFAYDNVRNLSLLVIRSGGNTGSTLWNYAFVGSNVSRRNTSGTAISSTTPLSRTDALLNLRLTFRTLPLPVTLVQFTAQAQGRGIQLAWRTASEIHAAHFEVERSLNGVEFTTIGQVPARGQQATTTAYQYFDTHQLMGLRYYRLRQLDQDGTASYSPTRAVTLSNEANLRLYPNPARTAVTVAGLRAGAAVQVLNALGQTVVWGVADATGTAQLALPAGLVSGIYVVRSDRQTRSLAVQ